MNVILASSFLALTFFQQPETLNVWRILIISKERTEIVFEYAWQVMPEQLPLKKGAIECFISRLKATRLFTDVKVDVKTREDGKGVDIDIFPTLDKRWKRFVIKEIEFDEFMGFDVPRIREALYKKNLKPGISLWKFSLLEMSNMIDDVSSKIYASDEVMKEQMFNLRIRHPRFYLQVVDSVNVKLTISLNRQYPCQPQ